MQIPKVLYAVDVDAQSAALRLSDTETGQSFGTTLRFLILNEGWKHTEFPSDPKEVILLALAALNAPHPDLETKICAAAYVLSRSANGYAAEART